MIPNSADEFDLELIEKLVSMGVFESDQFDFKLMLPDSRNDEAKRRLRETIAAFANSDGGYLIYGIEDTKDKTTVDRIVGIDKSYDIPAKFGDYASFSEPSVDWHFKNPPIEAHNGRLIHVIQIFSTWRKPHSVEFNKGNLIFPKRTNKGNERMSYHEVKSAFHETEFKRSKLALLISEIEFMKNTAERLLSNVPDPPPNIGGTLHWAWATRYNTTLIDQTLGDTFSFFSENIDLWNTLCVVRDSAKHSNVSCEAFSNIVFMYMTNKKQLNEDHYKTVRESAEEIVRNADKAKELLKELLS